MKINFLFIVLLISINFKVFGFEDADQYFENLNRAKNIEYEIKTQLPFIYNQMCMGGYMAMPSARSQDAGVLAFGYSKSSPYQILSVNLQYFDHLELSANFWIFQDILEGNFGSMGYGDDADRAANVKLIVLKRKDGFESLPEIAIGINDFYGSKRFLSKYIVLTKQFIDYNLEASVGYGVGRINGLFGAISYFPFFKKKSFFNKTAIYAEFDGNDYKNNEFEHPKAKDVNWTIDNCSINDCSINIGMNFSFFDLLNLSISSNRGKNVAISLAAYYNIGKSTGLFPKYLDPPLIQDFISDKNLCESLKAVFEEGGFDLMKISVFVDAKDQKCLNLQIINQRYRDEKIFKFRIYNILSNVDLNDYEKVFVRVEEDGLILHEYEFLNKNLQSLKDKKIGSFEFEATSEIKDFCFKEDEKFEKIIKQYKKKPWNLTIRPKINAFFWLL